MKTSSKLTLILIFGVLLPALVMTFVNFNETKRMMTKGIKSSLVNNVEQRVKDANKAANHLVGSLEILARNQLLCNELETENEDKLESIFDYTMKAHKFYDMFLIDDKGKILFTMKKEDDLHKNLNSVAFRNGKFAKTYNEAIRTRKTAISNFYYYLPSQRYAAFIVTPVLKRGYIIGAVAVQLDMDVINEIGNDYGGLGKSGDIILAQRDGDGVQFINKLNDKRLKRFERTIVLGSKYGIPVQKAVLKEFGSGVFHDYRGKDVIAAWGYIDSFDIGMVIKMDASEAYSGIDYLKKLSTFMGLVIFAFIFYLIYRIIHIVKDLDETKSQYELAINGTKDGLWDWDIRNNKLFFSKRLKAMLGYDESEFDSTLSGWNRLIHPDDLERVNAYILESHQTKREDYKDIYRLKHKDGHYIWILARGKIYYDKDKEAIRVSGFHTDISREKAQEIKIKHLSRLLTNTINSINNLIFVKDIDFIYLECNKAFEEFVGLPREEIIGKSDFDIFNEDVAKLFRKKDNDMLENKYGTSHYEWVTYPDGRKVYLLTVKAPLYDEENNISGLVGNAIDMTQSYFDKIELQNQEEIMIAQSRHAAMGEMISMIAHQWRQPISIIAMDANNILADIELDMLNEDELRESSKDIISQTQELSKTIDDFREFFKPNRQKEDIAVSSIIGDALGVIEKSLINNNIELEKEIDETIKVRTYSRELMQVVINIIKNAKEALDGLEYQKKIQISIYKENNAAIIKICDNGHGINDTIIDKIFNPYFTSKGDKNGTGLGLYISKTIIEKHLHGTISVYNQSQGVCFEIKINGVLEHE